MKQSALHRLRAQALESASYYSRRAANDNSFGVVSYDTLNRMATAVNGATTLATYTYNPLSQRTNLAYNGSAGATVAYTWTTADDLLTLTHNLLLTTNDVTYTETYTNAHQLATETISDTDYRFAPGANGTSAYASANNLNQYPSVTPAGGSAQTLTYDTRGNLTGDGTFTYTYDAENRLLTANKTGVAATYVYDPLGRRVKKSGTGVTTTYFLGDGDNEIAEYNTSGALQFRYVPGPAIDDPIAMVAGTGANPTVTYFHENKTGSVVAMSKTTSAIDEGPYTYDASGTASDTGGVPFKFTGRRLDSETGLYYYRARYYGPGTVPGGRFLQTDPVGYKDDLDLYTYVGNDPTDKIDPTGTEVEASFFLDSGVVSARDINTGETAYTDAFSGGTFGSRAGGAIPVGDYSILGHERNPAFFRLERFDNNFGDDRTPEGRSQLRLHLGTISIGCITLCRTHGGTVMDLIRRTETSQTTVRSQSWNPFIRTESATQYGSMAVRAKGDLRLNRKTGEITRVRNVTETGSRIPKSITEHVCRLQGDGTCK